ncbi:oxidoreductase C-terminal domain-containing protein [Pseudorhodoplanes sp.]|uniref:oxidoreductase C-terminal domain-containing protein n=1 Tax=Pseudorhodoplanes sp. TaxID=1934341 RepID=UPI003D150BBC
MQLLGHDFENGEMVTRRDANRNKLSYVRLDNEMIASAICVNSGQDIPTYRRLIQRGSKINPRQLSDVADPKQLLAKAATS